MNTRLLLACCLLICLVSGCFSSNDDHYSRIGSDYFFTNFTLAKPTGGTFALNRSELESLERVWFKAQIANEINICNMVNRTGAQMKYEFVLDDGFVAQFDASYGSVDERAYLNIELLGDGGGFPGDVYWELVAVDDIFSEERLAEFDLWVEAE